MVIYEIKFIWLLLGRYLYILNPKPHCVRLLTQRGSALPPTPLITGFDGQQQELMAQTVLAEYNEEGRRESSTTALG